MPHSRSIRIGAFALVALCASVPATAHTQVPVPASAQAPLPAGAPAKAADPAKAAEPAVASYVSSLINAKPLPVTDRATGDGGVQYLIEFDELILAIRAGHEFRASLRYRQTLAVKGGFLGRDPIQKMTVYGTWAVTGNEIRFVPDPKRGGNGLQILSGTFTGAKIEVPFDYRNGSVARRANVVLVKNNNIF